VIGSSKETRDPLLSEQVNRTLGDEMESESEAWERTMMRRMMQKWVLRWLLVCANSVLILVSWD
jgi:hypothetical protein